MGNLFSDTTKFIDASHIIKKYGNNANWMTENYESFKNIKLRDFVFPGTINSGTYMGNNPQFKCQRMTIYRQLTTGIRYLDIRLGPKSKNIEDVYIFMDSEEKYCLNSLVNLLKGIKSFIDDYPREFIILKICEVNDLSMEQRFFVKDIVESTFGRNKIVSKDDSDWFDIKTTTFGKIFREQKNYICFFDLSLCKDDISGVNKDFLDIQSHLEDFPIITRDKIQLYCSILKNFKESDKVDTRMQVSQFMLSVEKINFKQNFMD